MKIPNTNEIEVNIISCCLNSKDAFKKIKRNLLYEDFSSPYNKLFKDINELYKTHSAIDENIIKDTFPDSPILIDFLNSFGSQIILDEHIKLIKKASISKKLLQIPDIIRTSDDPYNIIDTIQSIVNSIDNSSKEKSLMGKITDHLEDAMTIKNLWQILLKEGYNASYSHIKKYIYRLIEQHKVFKVSRGTYQASRKALLGSINELRARGRKIDYELPLCINDFANVYPNSILMLASQAGNGKTHVFAYCIKILLQQGIPCVYWDLENESESVVSVLKKYIPTDLIENKDLFQMNMSEDIDIETLEVSPKRVNFIDPLYVVGDGWGTVDQTMRRIKKQLDGGLCFIASHLKDFDGKVFGGATAMKVPSIVMYLKHRQDRFQPEFIIGKVRNWKAGKIARSIKCGWDDNEGLINPVVCR